MICPTCARGLHRPCIEQEAKRDYPSCTCQHAPRGEFVQAAFRPASAQSETPAP